MADVSTAFRALGAAGHFHGVPGRWTEAHQNPTTLVGSQPSGLWQMYFGWVENSTDPSSFPWISSGALVFGGDGGYYPAPHVNSLVQTTSGELTFSGSGFSTYSRAYYNVVHVTSGFIEFTGSAFYAGPTQIASLVQATSGYLEFGGAATTIFSSAATDPRSFVWSTSGYLEFGGAANDVSSLVTHSLFVTTSGYLEFGGEATWTGSNVAVSSTPLPPPDPTPLPPPRAGSGGRGYDYDPSDYVIRKNPPKEPVRGFVHVGQGALSLGGAATVNMAPVVYAAVRLANLHSTRYKSAAVPQFCTVQGSEVYSAPAKMSADPKRILKNLRRQVREDEELEFI